MLHLLSLSKCVRPSYSYKALPTIANAYYRLLSDKGKKDGKLLNICNVIISLMRVYTIIGEIPKPLGSACNTQNEPPKTPTCKKDGK